MKKIFIVFVTACCVEQASAQLVTYAPTGDTSQSKVVLEGYIDAYFAFDGSQPQNGDRAYFVSQSRHNEFNINMAYLSLKFSSAKVRATFTPGFGTYMNANYGVERLTLKNIIEANVGVCLSKGKNIWLDVGVLPSPYTNETAISYDQINYSRSFAPEYVPYYLSGARLSIPLTRKVTAYLYLLNGWQVIEDVNMPLAFGSQLEYKPTDKISLYLNTYLGDEKSAATPENRKRYFLDFYMLYNPNEKWNLALSAYTGSQVRIDSGSEKKYRNQWSQANVAARYYLNHKNSISARAEYFTDPNEVMIKSATDIPGFQAASFTLGYNLAITKNVLFRVEGRYFHADKEIFPSHDGGKSQNNQLLMSGLTIKF